MKTSLSFLLLLLFTQIELLANDNRVCETTAKYKSEKPRKKRK